MCYEYPVPDVYSYRSSSSGPSVAPVVYNAHRLGQVGFPSGVVACGVVPDAAIVPSLLSAGLVYNILHKAALRAPGIRYCCVLSAVDTYR